MSRDRPVRIYIAAASSEMERAKRVMRRLELASAIVTSTWPANIRLIGHANPVDAPWPQRRSWSIDQLSEVEHSDVLIVLQPPKEIVTIGAWVELGYAMARKKTIASVVAPGYRSIFTAVGVEFETEDAAIKYALEQRLESSYG